MPADPTEEAMAALDELERIFTIRGDRCLEHIAPIRAALSQQTGVDGRAAVSGRARMRRYDQVAATNALERATLHIMKAAETEEGVDLHAVEAASLAVAALAKVVRRAIGATAPATQEAPSEPATGATEDEPVGYVHRLDDYPVMYPENDGFSIALYTHPAPPAAGEALRSRGSWPASPRSSPRTPAAESSEK